MGGRQCALRCSKSARPPIEQAVINRQKRPPVKKEFIGLVLELSLKEGDMFDGWGYKEGRRNRDKPQRVAENFSHYIIFALCDYQLCECECLLLIFMTVGACFDGMQALTPRTLERQCIMLAHTLYLQEEANFGGSPSLNF